MRWWWSVGCLVVATGCGPTAGSSSAEEGRTTGSTTGGDTQISASVSGGGADTTGASGAASTTGDAEDPWCFVQAIEPLPRLKVLVVVDASWAVTVFHGGVPAFEPWSVVIASVVDAVRGLEEHARARAQFALRVMPGPVGDDACGRSDAMDLPGWVTADELIAQLVQIEPQGGRAMRRTLEDLPPDVDYVLVFTHGAPGCGDDVSPDVLDEAVLDTILAQGLVAEQMYGDGAVVSFGNIAWPEGTEPSVPGDGEPDGVDHGAILTAIGVETSRHCVYPGSTFPGDNAVGIVDQCEYGEPSPGLCRLDVTGPAYGANPNAAAVGDLDELLVWVGDAPIPRVDECADEPAWRYAGAALPELAYESWSVDLCTPALCDALLAEGAHVQHSCNLDAPG